MSSHSPQRIKFEESDNYFVDYVNKSVRVDIRAKKSYGNAFKSCIKNTIALKTPFNLQLTYGRDVIDSLSPKEAAKFVSEQGIFPDYAQDEKNVESFVRNIEQNPENYSIEAYRRRAITKGDRTDFCTHSLYLITDKTTGKNLPLALIRLTAPFFYQKVHGR